MKLKTKLAFFFSALILCALTAFLGLRCQRRQVTRIAPLRPGAEKLRRQRLYHAESGRLSLLGAS